MQYRYFFKLRYIIILMTEMEIDTTLYLMITRSNGRYELTAQPMGKLYKHLGEITARNGITVSAEKTIEDSIYRRIKGADEGSNRFAELINLLNSGEIDNPQAALDRLCD